GLPRCRHGPCTGGDEQPRSLAFHVYFMTLAGGNLLSACCERMRLALPAVNAWKAQGEGRSSSNDHPRLSARYRGRLVRGFPALRARTACAFPRPRWRGGGGGRLSASGRRRRVV